MPLATRCETGATGDDDDDDDDDNGLHAEVCKKIK
jgi:hypothetical protein